MADHLRENTADPNQRKSDCKNLSSLSAAATYKEVVANREMFMETLEHLHVSKGTKFVIPTIGGKALDLHRLFVEVTSRGGLEMVIRDRKWRDVIAVFSFPSTITNASFVLRKYYISLLHDYEQLYFFREKSWPVSLDRNSETASAAVQAQVAKPPLEKENPGNQLTVGSLVSGTINGKCNEGYLVTVTYGSEKLQGILYHTPDGSCKPPSGSSSGLLHRQRDRKRSRGSSMELPRSTSDRKGCNYSAEQHAKIKPLYYGEDQSLTQKIDYLWSKLTDADRESYRSNRAP